MATAGSRSRTRLRAAVAALVVVALGLATALWLTRGDGTDDASVDTTPQPTAAPVTAAPETTAAPLTLPTTVPTSEAPTTTAAPATTAMPVVTAPPAPPAFSVVVTDPSGWSMSMDPSWTESAANGSRNWFTNTGSDSFDDNINVTTEPLTASITLDEYLAAAIAGIESSTPDFQLVDQRRVTGPDGVELIVIGWSATLPNLPPLSFLQTLTITPTAAYVATFTTEPARMPQLAPLFEPYLLTLRGV